MKEYAKGDARAWVPDRGPGWVGLEFIRRRWFPELPTQPPEEVVEFFPVVGREGELAMFTLVDVL